ncbi:unnamed protein product, partial [marine sediment metagenome]
LPKQEQPVPFDPKEKGYPNRTAQQEADNFFDGE